MPGFEIREELPRRAALSRFYVLQALTDTLFRIGKGSDVDQTSVAFAGR